MNSNSSTLQNIIQKTTLFSNLFHVLITFWMALFCAGSEAEQFRYKSQPESSWRESYYPDRPGQDLGWCGSSQFLVLGRTTGSGQGFRLLDASTGMMKRFTVDGGHHRGYCSYDGNYLFTIKDDPFAVGLIDIPKEGFRVLYSYSSNADWLARMLPFDFGSPISPNGKFMITIDQRVTQFGEAISLPILSQSTARNSGYRLAVWARDSSNLYLFGFGFIDVLNTTTQHITRIRVSIPQHKSIVRAIFSTKENKLFAMGYPDSGVGGTNLYAINISQPRSPAKLLLQDIEGFDVGLNDEIYFIKSVGKTSQSEFEAKYSKDAFDGIFVWNEGEQIELIKKYLKDTIAHPVISQDGEMLAFEKNRDLRNDDRGIAVLVKTTFKSKRED